MSRTDRTGETGPDKHWAEHSCRTSRLVVERDQDEQLLLLGGSHPDRPGSIEHQRRMKDTHLLVLFLPSSIGRDRHAAFRHRPMLCVPREPVVETVSGRDSEQGRVRILAAAE